MIILGLRSQNPLKTEEEGIEVNHGEESRRVRQRENQIFEEREGPSSHCWFEDHLPS